ERGRLIGPDDDRLDRPAVAVVSDDFWRSRLGADPGVVGRVLTVDGTPTTLVGVTPRDFRVPIGGSVLRADLWMPMRFSAVQAARRGNNYLRMIGRLSPSATAQSAGSEMHGLFTGLVAAYPQLRGEDLRVAPIEAESAATVRTPLLLLFGAVCMVLLIAATNVAALLLARGVHRRREMAVRVALGASRWSAMRPALVESVVITAAGATLGILLAVWGVRTIGRLAAQRMQQLGGLSIDGRVIAFALVLSVVVAFACGAVPAWRGAAVDPQDALRGGRGGGAGRDHQRALRALVIIEIASSLVLLIGAGLVLKGFAGLVNNDPGFETTHVLTMQVTTSSARYANETSVRQFLEPALASIRNLPGVEAAGSVSLIPYENWGSNSNMRYEGQPADDPTRMPLVEQRVATPGFFAVTKQRLISGRLLGAGDDETRSSPYVVVVNQALVDRDFKGHDPIGRRFYTGDTTFGTIVGVVSDIRNSGPFEPAHPEMYGSYRQNALGSSSFPLMVRVRGGDPSAVTSAVRAAIRAVDPTAAVSDVSPMPDVIARSLGRPKFYFSLLGSFAAVAVVLAVAGLYGVMSYAMAQRTREIGIRAALGAPRGALLRLVTLEGGRLVGGGLIVGLLGAAAVTRLMTFMLYGVNPLDMSTWIGAAFLLAAAALGASLVPARRAARVDPLIAIQVE
ncbi:MAG TPA: ADOP family duplicated permease, partial [Gemmatimonadaceae bacterium]